MLDWLKDYLQNNPIEKIKEEWKEIESNFPAGVNACEYINYSKHYFSCINSSPGDFDNKIFFQTNTTPDFTGSFFLV